MECHEKHKAKSRKSAEESSPIFEINRRTNAIINERRLKFSSVRQKNVDRVIRQTKKQGMTPNIQHDELAAIERTIDEIQKKILDTKSNRRKGKCR